jgi:hypothetical protein
MRHKMINLDPTAHEYASQMPNFSQWVRKCIRDHYEGEDTVYLKEQIADLQKLLSDIKAGRRYWDGNTWMVVE